MISLRSVFVWIVASSFVFLPQLLSAQITIINQDFLNMIWNAPRNWFF